MSYSSAQSSSWQLKIRQRKQRNYIFIEATRRKEEPSSRVRKVTKALSYRCSRNELSEAHLQAAQGSESHRGQRPVEGRGSEDKARPMGDCKPNPGIEIQPQVWGRCSPAGTKPERPGGHFIWSLGVKQRRNSHDSDFSGHRWFC